MKINNMKNYPAKLNLKNDHSADFTSYEDKNSKRKTSALKREKER
jgi:hypothetical protein